MKPPADYTCEGCGTVFLRIHRSRRKYCADCKATRQAHARTFSEHTMTFDEIETYLRRQNYNETAMPWDRR